MTLKALHDKALLAHYFRQTAPHLHVYSIGDLDDFFWPYTQWYGVYEGGELRGVLLVYMGSSLPNVPKAQTERCTMTEQPSQPPLSTRALWSSQRVARRLVCCA